MRRLPSLVAAATLLAASLAPSGPTVAAAEPACSPGPLLDTLQTVLTHLTYTVHTELETPGGDVVKDTPALVGVPTLVSPRATGGPDLVVTVLPKLDRTLSLTVTRLPSAPTPLPLRVEAVVDLDGGGTARVGYDAADVADPTDADPFRTTTTSAPARWTLDAAVSRCAEGTFLDLTQKTPGRAAPLAVIGSVSTDASSTAAKVALEPVPATTRLTATITDGELTGDVTRSTTAEFGLAPDTSTAATVDARLAGERTTTVHAELPALPATTPDLPAVVVTSLDQESTDERLHRLSLRALNRLPHARVVLRQDLGQRRLVDVTSTMTHLPHAFSVDLADVTEAGVTRHEVDYGSALFKGTVEELDELTVDGTLVAAQESTRRGDPDTTSVAATVSGVPQHLGFSLTPPDEEDAPDLLAASLSTGADGVTAGPPLDSLDARIVRDDDPAELTAAEQLPAGQDGVLLTTARALLGARHQTVHLHVTGPRLLTFRRTVAPTSESGVHQQVVNTRLVTDPGAPSRSFLVRLETSRPTAPTGFTQAAIDPVPDDVAVTAVSKAKDAGGEVAQQIAYFASERTDSVRFATDEGQRQVLRAELHSPAGATEARRVPKELHLCISPLTGRCSGAVLTGAQRDDRGASIKVSTPTGELHGSFFDCVDGPSADTCAPENASEFKVARFNIAPVGVFALDIHAPPIKGGAKGHVFVDTDDNLLDGDLEIVAGSTDPCESDDTHIVGTLDDVKAADRFAVVEVENAGCFKHGLALSEERGHMTCGPGTVIDLAAGKVGGGVANDFCQRS